MFTVGRLVGSCSPATDNDGHATKRPSTFFEHRSRLIQPTRKPSDLTNPSTESDQAQGECLPRFFPFRFSLFPFPFSLLLSAYGALTVISLASVLFDSLDSATAAAASVTVIRYTLPDVPAGTVTAIEPVLDAL
jgi:hypothetical protein